MPPLNVRTLSRAIVLLMVGASVAIGGLTVARNAVSAADDAANPCTAKNPCGANPCAANPCTAKNPCAANPCAATNPCAGGNPCAANPCAANPCASNPCAPASAAKLSDTKAADAYNGIVDKLQAGYAKSGHPAAAAYINWKRYNKVPYVSTTHGGRFVNNFANDIAEAYGRFEDAGVMPAGSVLAKNSFRVTSQDKIEPGPLFLMEKMSAGFSTESRDWRYTLIMPDGNVFGATRGDGSANVQFCADCHGSVSKTQDSLFFMPEDYRVKY